MSDARDLDAVIARAAAAPDDARAQHALGVLLLEGGAAEDLPRAIQALRAAVALDDRRADCRAAIHQPMAVSKPIQSMAIQAAAVMAPREAEHRAYCSSKVRVRPQIGIPRSV